MNLLKETHRLIKRSKLPPKEVYKGAKVQQRWYYMFLKDEIPDPGVKKVQKIYNYLSKL